MKNHELKTNQDSFDKILGRLKTVETSWSNEDYKIGDTINFREYFSDTKTYSGRSVLGTILFVLECRSNVEHGFVVFSFRVDNYIYSTDLNIVNNNKIDIDEKNIYIICVTVSVIMGIITFFNEKYENTFVMVIILYSILCIVLNISKTKK